MKRLFLCLIAICLFPLGAHAQRDTQPASLTSAEFASVHPALSLRIHGVKNARAIAFHSTRSYLGVQVGQKLIWKLMLPAMPKKLGAPSQSGLFTAWVPAHPGTRFYAFSLHGSRVRPAIEGVTTGFVHGAEGGSFSADSIVLRMHDSGHQGSVSYRLLDHYSLCSAGFCQTLETREPDYPASSYPRPNGVIHNKHGDTLLLKLEVAATDADRERGLMGRTSMDPDSGMVFVWDAPVLDPFWMYDTPIPLSIAFLAPDGTVLDVQDMEAESQDYHYPTQAYQYAIEVNQGYFAKYAIQAGDKVKLDLTSQ